jgi:hypothetical protein
LVANPHPEPYAEPVAFLRSLWADNGEGFLPLWWRDTHTTEFVALANIETEVPRLLAERGDVNVYFGLGLQPTKLPGQQRGLQQHVIAIPGIWLDLDTMAGHSGGNGKVYPPDKEAAASILDGLPARPCWLIDSGNGLHAYWRFKEPWYFSHQAENLAAQRASKGWEVLARKAAAAKGWTVDACADLARVMRLPGTVNRKDGLPDAPCVVLEAPRGYASLNPADFEQWVPDGVSIGPELHREPLLGGDFTIRNNAPVPDAVMILKGMETRFAKTWDRKRTSAGPGALSDLSSSGYELSLCTQMVNSGMDLDNQTLTDMCAAFRRLTDARGKQALDKGVRYYEDLFRKARASRGQPDTQVVRDALATQVEREKAEEVETAKEEGREIDLLKAAIPAGPDGRPIGNLDGLEGIIKRGRTDARYYLVISGSEVLVGNLKDLQDWKKFRTYLGDQLSRLIGPVNRKANDWDRLVDTMLHISVKEEYGQDGDEWEVLLDALEEYVVTNTPPPRPNEPVIKRHAVKRRLPWLHQGELGVSRSHFAAWLESHEKRRREAAEVRSFLRRILGESVSVTARPYRDASGGPVTKNYYVGTVPDCLAGWASDLAAATKETEHDDD